MVRINLSYVFAGALLVKSRAVLHKDSANDVSTVQSNAHVVLVIQRHISEDRDHGTHQVRTRSNSRAL